MPLTARLPAVIVVLTGLLLSVPALVPMRVLAAGTQLKERLQRLDNSIANNRQDEAAQWIVSVRSDPALDTNTRESLLYRGTLSLGSLSSPDGQIIAEVKSLLGYLSSSTTILAEGNRMVPVPLHDVASAARLTLGNWRALSARRDILEKVTLGQAPLPRWSGEPQEDHYIAMGLQQALADLSPDVLHAIRGQVSAAFDSEPRLAGGVLLIARRLGDAGLYNRLAIQAPPTVVLDMMRDLGHSLDAAQSLTVLNQVRRRDELASAAILATGRLQAGYPGAKEQLFSLLGDERDGASAASALARYSAAPDILRLGSVVTDAGAGIARKRAMLALRLNNTATARSELARLAIDRRVPTRIRKEIAQWLDQ